MPLDERDHFPRNPFSNSSYNVSTKRATFPCSVDTKRKSSQLLLYSSTMTSKKRQKMKKKFSMLWVAPFSDWLADTVHRQCTVSALCLARMMIILPRQHHSQFAKVDPQRRHNVRQNVFPVNTDQSIQIREKELQCE